MSRLLLLGALGALFGCTDAQLYSGGSQPNYANKISFEGDLCTDDPSAVAFPVKVLLVMDGTAQMVSADPTGTRASGMTALFAHYPTSNYTFGVTQYGSQSRSLTGGFATDTSLLQPAIDTVTIGTTDAQRDYYDALQQAATIIEDDILGSTPGVRSRTRYVVIFVADGPPTPDMPSFWCPTQNIDPTVPDCQTEFTANFCPGVLPPPTDCERLLYPQMITDMRAFVAQYGAQDLVFDTIGFGANARMTTLLTEMALAGHGSFLPQMANRVNLLAVDIARPSALLVKRELVVYSPAAVLTGDAPVPDSDGDGLTDAEEMKIGTNPLNPDTDGDFVGDQIEVMLAAPNLPFNPLIPATPSQCLTIMPLDKDSDADGLTDCEEALLRTDPSLVDTDKDGIPDLVEVRRGGNPLVDDRLADTDADGILNGDELKRGLNPSVNDSNRELDYGYIYQIVDKGPTMQLEAVPDDPLPGTQVTQIMASGGSTGTLHYDPGPPATLAWTESPMLPLGMAVDVSKGGTFTLTSSKGQILTVNVDPQLLPPVDGGPQDGQLYIRTTNRFCFHFDVRNVTLVETLEAQGGLPGIGWNPIRIYLSEVPAETPMGNSIVDQGTFPVRFIAPDKKTPNKPFITVGQDALLLLGSQ